MIMGSDTKLEIGKEYTPVGIVLKGENVPPQPIFIVREATREEWIECNTTTYGACPCAYSYQGYFYEVSTD